jgi:hypothetical protein
MVWEPPTLREIKMDAEFTAYVDEDLDDRAREEVPVARTASD